MSNTISPERRKGRIRPCRILLSVITLIEPALILAGLYQWPAIRTTQPQYQARAVPVVGTVTELGDRLVSIEGGRAMNCKLQEIFSTKSRRRT